MLLFYSGSSVILLCVVSIIPCNQNKTANMINVWATKPTWNINKIDTVFIPKHLFFVPLNRWKKLPIYMRLTLLLVINFMARNFCNNWNNSNDLKKWVIYHFPISRKNRLFKPVFYFLFFIFYFLSRHRNFMSLLKKHASNMERGHWFWSCQYTSKAFQRCSAKWTGSWYAG